MATSSSSAAREHHAERRTSPQLSKGDDETDAMRSGASDVDESGDAHDYQDGAEETYDDLEGLPSDFDPEDPNHPPLPPLATLPIANISRLMKLSIPASSKIARDAKDCVQDSVCEFIAFLTSEAADRCLDEKRKTINGDDVLYAMRTLGFDDYEAVCNVWLSRYRMVSQLCRKSVQQRRSSWQCAARTSAGDSSLFER